MATSESYVEFVCEQIKDLGAVRSKKMFGEYMVYLNDKPIFLLCDNCVYIKKLPAVSDYMDASCVGVPYPQAKEHYILDIEDRDLSQKVALALEMVTAIPKSRKKKLK